MLQPCVTVEFPEECQWSDFIDQLLSESRNCEKMVIKVAVTLSKMHNLMELLYRIVRLPDTGMVRESRGIRGFWPSSWYLDLSIDLELKRYVNDIPLQVWILPKIEKLAICAAKGGNENYLSPLIGYQKDLISLDVKTCSLSNIPDNIRYCLQLSHFLVDYNRLHALSGFIKELPNLEVLRRMHNLFFYGSSYKTTALKIEATSTEEEAEKIKLFSPDSLIELCTKQIAHSSVEGTFALNILAGLPIHIVSQINTWMSQYMLCDSCKHSFYFETGYQVYHLEEKFRGYVNLPLEYHACSDTCKEKLETNCHFNRDNNLDVPVYMNIEAMRKLEKNRNSCFNFMKRRLRFR